MIVSFILGWVAGIIGTLMFGKWWSDREIKEYLDNYDKRSRDDP